MCRTEIDRSVLCTYKTSSTISVWPAVVADDTQEEVHRDGCLAVTQRLALEDKEKEQSLADVPSRPLANWLLIVHRHGCWCSPVPIKPRAEQSRGPPGLVIVTGVHFGWRSCSQHEKQQ